MNRLQNSTSTMPVLSKDKAKDWQLEILMEKLRSKASQYKSLAEISKNVRMALLEKRYALDSVEKSQHQKCLDTLQHSIKVTCLQTMIERLESLTRQLGLKFVVESSGVFISSDMFYLEIVLESTGAVKDVKIHHEGKNEQQSCMELVNCLSRGDFTDFTTQLEGFVSIYQLNAEKKVKCKAFTALESLETDLCTLAQLQLFMKEPFNLIHKSPVGILEKRKGGHPMKLTYFVSPYELLNTEKNDLDAISIESVISKNLGYSVTVCMEGSAAHKLQTTTLITVSRNINGKNTPSYSPLTSQNSALIPACFVLKLSKPMPMCVSLVRQIQQIQQWTDIDNIPPQPLLNLIVSHSSDGKLSSMNNKGLFVTLPDQNHCYFLTENKNMDGVFVSNIPFTHPAHVAKILMILREQALFNTVMGSCVRPNSRQDFDNMTMFEVSALSSTQISISLEHPLEESMATAEIDLSDISNLVCHIHNPGTPPPTNAPDLVSELATKVLNKSFSIPVTLRAVIKMWEKQAVRRTHYGGHENFSLPLGSIDPGGHKGPGPGAGLSEFGGAHDKIKQEPGQIGGPSGHHGMMMQAQQGMWNESMITSNFPNFPPSDAVLTNIELSNILVGSTIDKLKRHKRKASDDIWKNSIKNRKVGEDELVESSSCDSTSRSTPLSHDPDTQTPNSGLGFHSDLELSGLDPSELLDSDKLSTDYDDEPANETIVIGSSKKKEKSPTNLLSDLGEKNLVPPNVSITPISSSSSPNFSGGNPEKRTSIEIIPLAQPANSLLPSSITITPISSTQKNEDRKEKKSSKSNKDDKNRLEKKRKKKRDDSPMGPPGKVPPKQDPLTKPVSVSIRPAESPPLPTSTPTSPNMMRKFSPSPTHNRPLSLSGKLSPSLIKPNLKTSTSSHHSPKHSPAHVPSSPKHTIPGISSPKSHGTSPKHPSTSGSGKPSMSTLKNAANSPSSKSSSDKNKSSKDSSREKDKTRSVFSVSNSKNKSSSIKVKPLDLNMCEVSQQDGLPSPSGESKSSLNQVRNRKGSLSAIVDKLKNAQCESVSETIKSSGSSSGGSGSSRDRTAPSSKDGKSGAKVGETKNSEYMVKPSSDGMKITINKTRTKDSSSKSSSSGTSSSNLTRNTTGGTGSPKTHTGLKPGVNSGPASKKPQQFQKSTGNSGNLPNSVNSSTNYSSSAGSNAKTTSNSSSSTTKPPSSTSSSSSSGSSKISSSSSAGVSSSKSSVSKLTSSPKTSSSSSAADLSRTKDRVKPSKSSSEKSIFSSLKERGKSSPTQSDVESNFKVNQSKMDPYSSSLMMEGMMKTLDKNFQIPKLSARGGADEKKSKNDINNVNRSTVDTKIFDLMSKNDIVMPKFPIATLNSVDPKMRGGLNNLLGASPKVKDDDDEKKKDVPQNLSSTQGKDDSTYKLDTANKQYPPNTASEPLSLSTKTIDLTSKFVAPAPRDDKRDKMMDDAMLLDYSSKSLGGGDGGPSVSVHIVKSPSPLINPSPRSTTSPCITDDELMDEALIGLVRSCVICICEYI